MEIAEILKKISIGYFSKDDLDDIDIKPIIKQKYKYIKSSELFSVTKIMELTEKGRTFWWQLNDIQYNNIYWSACFSSVYLSEFNDISRLNFRVEIKRRSGNTKVRDYIFELFDESTQEFKILRSDSGIKLYDKVLLWMKNNNESFLKEYYTNTLWGKLKSYDLSYYDLNYFLKQHDIWDNVEQNKNAYKKYLNRNCEIVDIKTYIDDTGFILTLISVIDYKEYFIPEVVTAILIESIENKVLLNYTDHNKDCFNFGYFDINDTKYFESKKKPTYWYFPEITTHGYSSKKILDISFEDEKDQLFKSIVTNFHVK